MIVNPHINYMIEKVAEMEKNLTLLRWRRHEDPFDRGRSIGFKILRLAERIGIWTIESNKESGQLSESFIKAMPTEMVKLSIINGHLTVEAPELLSREETDAWYLLWILRYRIPLWEGQHLIDWNKERRKYMAFVRFIAEEEVGYFDNEVSEAHFVGDGIAGGMQIGDSAYSIQLLYATAVNDKYKGTHIYLIPESDMPQFMRYLNALDVRKEAI